MKNTTINYAWNARDGDNVIYSVKIILKILINVFWQLRMNNE